MTTPQRVLVVGSGAREHALAWRLARDQGVRHVHVAPGNPGMVDVATVHSANAMTDIDGVVELARRLSAELVVVGPEAPLAAGLADRLMEAGVPVFGPRRAAARLESSKTFCRAVAEQAGVQMAEGASFDQSEAAIAYVRALAAPVAVKADGLAGGKGVTICPTLADAERALRAALDGGAFGEAGRQVVVERLLSGRELTLMAICDGERAIALPAARDHKRLADGDRGPNTGGMGAVSPVADLDDKDAERYLDAFHRPVLAEMARRGNPFRGLLYAGLMLTDEGPRLLEFNVRFGDPEAQAVVPRLDGPLAATLLAAATGSSSAAGRPDLQTSPTAAVAVVLAARGYPDSPTLGEVIEGIDDVRAAGGLVFHGATTVRERRYVSHGGRVLTVVGRGRDVEAARDQAYSFVDRLHFAGMHYRLDIGDSVTMSRELVA